MKRRKVRLWIAFLILVGMTTAAGTIRRHATEAAIKDVISWRASYPSAQLEALKDHKQLFVEFMAHWCPDCAALERKTWGDPHAAEALEGYVPVQVDLDANPELAAKYHVEAIPTLLIINPNNGQVQKEKREEIPSADDLAAWLN